MKEVGINYTDVSLSTPSSLCRIWMAQSRNKYIRFQSQFYIYK